MHWRRSLTPGSSPLDHCDLLGEWVWTTCLSVMSHLSCNLVAGLTRTKLHAALYSGNELRNSATRHVTPANLMQESKLRDKVARRDITLRFPPDSAAGIWTHDCWVASWVPGHMANKSSTKHSYSMPSLVSAEMSHHLPIHVIGTKLASTGSPVKTVP